jgi:hypothetical protein
MVLADGASTYLRLGEASGTTAVDQLGVNNGTYVNSPTLGVAGLITGDANTAAKFVAASLQEVTVPGPVLSTNGSIEFWFKWTAGSALLRDNVGAGVGWLIFDSAGTLGVRVGEGTTRNTSVPTGTAMNGAKHYLVVGKTGIACNVYFDGVNVLSSVCGNIAAMMPWHAARNGINAQYTDAMIDELAFYPTELSAARVAAHYAKGL